MDTKSRMSKVSRPVMTLAALTMIGAGFGAAAFASADTTTVAPSTAAANAIMGDHRGGGFGKAPGVRGTVASISGSTITVTSTDPQTSVTTTYTVDASAAKVQKFSSVAPTAGTKPAAPAAIAVSQIAVGDTVGIRGTVSGTSVTATDIMDGMPAFGGMGGRGGEGMRGDRGATGTITAVSGNTVTIADAAGKTYTIDASGATVERVSTITVSGLSVGDKINAEGTVSGTAITAKHIVDGVMTEGPESSE